MPVSTLVTTAGASNANAYCDVAFADQYNLDRPPVGTTWVSATPDQKSAAILWATILMDRWWIWTGYPTDDIQKLLWPRTGMLKLSGWSYVDFHIIPTEIQQATAEYARNLLVSDRTGDNLIQSLGLTSLTAGPVSMAFKDSVYAKPVPDVVVGLVPAGWGYPRNLNPSVRKLLRT